MIKGKILDVNLCKLLDEVAMSLYHVYDVHPSGINAQHYADLTSEVESLMKDLKCPMRRR